MTGDDAVAVPWTVLADYQCFGCSPHNRAGLQLRSYRHPDGLQTRLRFTREHESYPGVVHGGITTTACDEMMGNLIVLRTGHSAFTITLRTRFVEPLRVGADYRCVASLRGNRWPSDQVLAVAEIIDAAGSTVVTATGHYRTVPFETARQQMTLSDAEAGQLRHRLAAAQAGLTNPVDE